MTAPEGDDRPDAAPAGVGRSIFLARPWEFRLGVAAMNGLPPAEGVEVAFAGRSNVGKSSLINALLGRRALARTSNTPGRTQELNYFGSSAPLTLVDMPGYGYAKVSKEKTKAWTKLIFDYLKGRANLRRVYVLIDARHGLKANDLEVLELLDKAAVSYQIVLTKADRPASAEVARVVSACREALRKRPAAHPEVLATSSMKDIGLDRLRDEIAVLIPAGDLSG
jgi:GTP-binding protein